MNHLEASRRLSSAISDWMQELAADGERFQSNDELSMVIMATAARVATIVAPNGMRRDVAALLLLVCESSSAAARAELELAISTMHDVERAEALVGAAVLVGRPRE